MKHEELAAELGRSGIVKEKLVYSRAHKRVRKAELQQGSTEEDAKRVAQEAARNAVKFFLDEGSDAN